MQLLVRKEKVEDKGVIDSEELIAPLANLIENKIQLLQNNISSLQLIIADELSSLKVLSNSKEDIENLEKLKEIKINIINSLLSSYSIIASKSSEEIKDFIINELQNIKNILKNEVKNEFSLLQKNFKIDDNHITFSNILTLQPRILPKNSKKFSLAIDAKDNKLKFYDGSWKIIKLE